MEMESREKIAIMYDHECFFHVSGDNFKYYDLELIVKRHPELEDYVTNNRYELNRSFNQLKEMNETYEAERNNTGK